MYRLGKIAVTDCVSTGFKDEIVNAVKERFECFAEEDWYDGPTKREEAEKSLAKTAKKAIKKRKLKAKDEKEEFDMAYGSYDRDD